MAASAVVPRGRAAAPCTPADAAPHRHP